MSDPKEYGREVNEFINQFCAVDECQNGKWMAYLDPTHDFVREGKQPPGQVNRYMDGDPTYSPGNEFWDGLPPEFERISKNRWRLVWPIDLSKQANRLLWNAAWAGRPCFDTAWGARAKIEEWVRLNRPDIVNQAEINAREALAYRRRQENANA